MPINISLKAIVPKDMSQFDGAAYIGRLARAQLSVTMPALADAFKKTVDGWEHKPVFKSEQKITRDSILMRVSATGQHADQYALVNNGSPPHTIGAVFSGQRGGLLKFQPGYRAATSPRVLSSRRKQRFGRFVNAVKVNHPGFEGREFDTTIADLFEPIFRDDMQSAMAP